VDDEVELLDWGSFRLEDVLILSAFLRRRYVVRDFFRVSLNQAIPQPYRSIRIIQNSRMLGLDLNSLYVYSRFAR